jgi:hypothetical protein
MKMIPLWHFLEHIVGTAGLRSGVGTLVVVGGRGDGEARYSIFITFFELDCPQDKTDMDATDNDTNVAGKGPEDVATPDADS